MHSLTPTPSAAESGAERTGLSEQVEKGTRTLRLTVQEALTLQDPMVSRVFYRHRFEDVGVTLDESALRKLYEKSGVSSEMASVLAAKVAKEPQYFNTTSERGDELVELPLNFESLAHALRAECQRCLDDDEGRLNRF